MNMVNNVRTSRMQNAVMIFWMYDEKFMKSDGLRILLWPE